VCLATGAAGETYCVLSCDPAGTDCRDGLSCWDLGDGTGACFRGCTEDTQCTSTGYCDVENSFCACPEGQAVNPEGTACVDVVCGDGSPIGDETCDDGDTTAGDGCSATCQVEFGWACEGTPSVCTAMESLGTFDPGDAIPDTTGGPLADGETDYYTITFTGDVAIDGTLTCTSGDGDVDYYMWNEDGSVYFSHAVEGDETWTNDSAGADTYVIAVNAYAACTSYTLTLSTVSVVCGDSLVTGAETCDDGGVEFGDGCSPTCAVEFGYTCTAAEPSVCTAIPSIGTFAPGAAIPNTVGGPLAAGEWAYYMITFTGNLELNGTLTSTDGDADMGITDATTYPGFLYSYAATGDETIDAAGLNAGTYMIAINAYEAVTSFTLTLSTVAVVCGDGAIGGMEGCDDGDATAGDGCSATCAVEAGFTCTGEPSVCEAIPSIGSFGAGDAIPNQTGGPLDAGESDIYQITFTEDVVLDGTLTADADADFYMYNADGSVYFVHYEVGNEDWTGDVVPADTYTVEINAYEAITAYTLTLSTAP